MSLKKERNNKIFQAVLTGYTGREENKQNVVLLYQKQGNKQRGLRVWLFVGRCKKTLSIN